MKVLQICPDFVPAIGGAATHFFRLSSELSKLGHRVDVFTTDLIGKGEKSTRVFEQMDDFAVRRFRTTRMPLFGQDVGNIPFGMLPHILREKQHDIVHVHAYRFFPTWLVPILRTIHPRIPVVMTSHTASGLHRPVQVKLFDLTWGKLIFKYVSLVITLTESDSENVSMLGCTPEKIVIIPNGVDPTVLDYEPDIVRFRTEFNISEAKIILFVGRIGLGKGLDILLDAIPQVTAEYGDDVRFVLVGPDWGDRQMLEKRAEQLRIAPRILFTGPLVGDMLLDAYHSADVFVLLSRFDASPIVLVEAMAAGKPVVATRVGGIPNIIREQVTGLLVEPESPSAAARAIIRLLSDCDFSHQLGLAGKKLVRERYQWNQIASRVSNLYSDLLRLGAGRAG